MPLTHPATPDQSRFVRTPMKITGIGRACYSPDVETPVTPPPVDPKPETLTITKADLDAKIEAAIAAERQTQADKLKADKDAADVEDARKKGEWEKLATAAEKRATDAEQIANALRLSTTLTDHLAADHPEYLTKKKYIEPMISKGLTGDALITAVKTACAEFVNDNPIQARPGGAGAPPARGTRLPPGRMGNDVPNPGSAYARSRYTGPAVKN